MSQFKGTQNLLRALQKAGEKAVSQHLRERLQAIRLPTTGEFPTVVVEMQSLEDVTIRVEASSALIEHAKAQLSPAEAHMVDWTVKSQSTKPLVFLSYAGEDSALAETIAQKLNANGIEVWWAQWEMKAGDSLRQKIDAGLGRCTHFLVLLTSTSIGKPWVNLEMDAALVRRLQDQCAFIPLRHQLPVAALPPLLSGLNAPEVLVNGADLMPLVHDILGVSRKPPLGELPAIARTPNTSYSPAATVVAEVFVREATHATMGEVPHTVAALVQQTGLSADDVVDALYELRAFFREAGDQYLALPTLFARFDAHFVATDPQQDALKLAADLLNDPQFPTRPRLIAERYGWTPRRLNPAIAFLEERQLADIIGGNFDAVPFNIHHIGKSDATRRFVKSRS